MTKLKVGFLCPRCDSTAVYEKTDDGKLDRTRMHCLICKWKGTTKAVERHREEGFEEIDGHKIHRVHRRLASILMDGHIVALCKSSRADIEVALQELLDIGLSRVFEHLLDRTETIVIEGEDVAEVVQLSERKGK